MNGSHIDVLARWLGTTTRSRRGSLHLVGSALAAVGAPALTDAAERVTGDGKVTTQGDRNRTTRRGLCRPSGIKCKLKNASSPRGLCKNCCETFQKRSKSAGRCCTRNGRPCESAAECCLGVCSVGRCQNEVIQLPPPCVPYGLPCAVTTDCCRYSDGSHIPCSGGFCRED
jgi:hypothetical protein